MDKDQPSFAEISGRPQCAALHGLPTLLIDICPSTQMQVQTRLTMAAAYLQASLGQVQAVL